MKVIILAGGRGVRLWPLSRNEFPKQFFRLGGELSLLQKTVKRFLAVSFIDEIVISTSLLHESLVSQQLQEINALQRCRILLEPCRKNTGPAIAVGVNFLKTACDLKQSDEILVLPSDHLIEPESTFLQSIAAARGTVQRGCIALFGIRPTRAETGYGYFRIGEAIDEVSHRISSFIEKPELHLAKEFIQNSEYYWNAGIFMFSLRTFETELKEHAPDLLPLLIDPLDAVLQRYAQFPAISIDYSVMEKSKKIFAHLLSVSWSDIGTWESIYEVMEKDDRNNVKIGNVVDIETKNCLIYGDKRIISTIGLEDLLIVDTEEAIFISKKGESQKIKQHFSIEEMKRETSKKP